MNYSVDPVEGYPIGFIGLKHVPSQMVRLVRFHVPFIKCLSITKNLVVSELLADGKILVARKH